MTAEISTGSVAAYGVRERTELEDELAAHVEAIRLSGFAVLPKVFSTDEMASIRRLMDETYDQQKGESKRVGLGADEDVIRCPLAYHPDFLKVSAKEVVLQVIGRLLGESYVLLMQNGIINRPAGEHFQAQWHRDLNYQHWVSSRPIAINFLVCVDQFFTEGGATLVLPGSHRFERFPSDRYVREHEVAIDADIGSVIMMDAMCFHRAGVNRTKDFTRRGLNHVVGVPILSQQIDLPRLLKSRGFDYAKDAFLSRYLGYRWMPAPDPQSWREVRQPTRR